MAMLGDILADAHRRAPGIERWLARDHPDLHARATAAAAEDGAGFADFVLATVTDFCRDAAGEDWATLTSSLRDSPDPGAACLLAMLQWRLGPLLATPERHPRGTSP